MKRCECTEKQTKNKKINQINITVSTQFRAYPFERALFSALNRVLLKN